MIKERLLIITVAILLTVCMTGCNSSNESLDVHDETIDEQRDLSVIYISHYRFGWCEVEYKVDLTNKQLWRYELQEYDSSRNIRREEMSENEGFTYICGLEDSMLDSFILKSKECKFFQWEGRYANESLDGHQWEITLVFSDGIEQESSGSNEYPMFWNEMYTAFLELTGEKVLFKTS